MIAQDTIFEILSQQLPKFSPVGNLQPLQGGNLNHVWRLTGKKQSIIIKWAPPHIAANPEVPLSPKRLEFEAQALDLYADGGLLESLANEDIRPPKLLHFEQNQHLLVMEDLGESPSLANWIDSRAEEGLGKQLGHFIGQLHKITFEHNKLGQQFHNIDIQQTRQKVQYSPAADYLRQTGLRDVDFNLISKKTKALGQRLLEPGKCLVMGDLWPPSVLVDNGKLRLIDWEFVHYGLPLQDVGHFAAHCWMQAHCTEHGQSFRLLWQQFWDAYRQALGDTWAKLFDEAELDAMATHVGAEILVRAAGPFQDGYVYEGLDVSEKPIQEAVEAAAQFVCQSEFTVIGEL
jgi:5-methylthioribose kinase